MALWQYPALTETPNATVAVVTPKVALTSMPDILFRPARVNAAEANLSWDPNTAFPERAQLDKFAPIFLDFIFRRPPNNVGESYAADPNTSFPERVSVDRWIGWKSDYIFRRPPNNVGPEFMPLVTTFYPERPQVDKFGPSAPDVLFRRPPLNAGPLFMPFQISAFPERVSLDKFQPSYIDRFFPRAPNNVGEPFAWNSVQLVPPFVMSVFTSLSDVLFRRPPNNVGDPLSWDPNTAFAERVQADKFLGYQPSFLWRAVPLNVGPALLWGAFTPTTSFNAIGSASYPDLINRRAPNPVTEYEYMDPNTVFPESVTVDRWAGLKPDWIIRAKPINVGPTGDTSWLAGTVAKDLNLVTYPDLFLKVRPVNVGPSFLWGHFTPAVFTPLPSSVFADLINRRAPNNVGDAFFLDPNVTFKERITVDKWIGYYPVWLPPRCPNNVGEPFTRAPRVIVNPPPTFIQSAILELMRRKRTWEWYPYLFIDLTGWLGRGAPVHVTLDMATKLSAPVDVARSASAPVDVARSASAKVDVTRSAQTPLDITRSQSQPLEKP